jgi:hypothetical protein
MVVALSQNLTKTSAVGQRVALRDVTWQGYQDILQALSGSRSARLTFDRGMLEIAVPSQLHEFSGRLIELFIRILVVELQRSIVKISIEALNPIMPSIFKTSPKSWDERSI